jgi:hypothetical protein
MPKSATIYKLNSEPPRPMQVTSNQFCASLQKARSDLEVRSEFTIVRIIVDHRLFSFDALIELFTVTTPPPRLMNTSSSPLSQTGSSVFSCIACIRKSINRFKATLKTNSFVRVCAVRIVRRSQPIRIKSNRFVLFVVGRRSKSNYRVPIKISTDFWFGSADPGPGRISNSHCCYLFDSVALALSPPSKADHSLFNFRPSRAHSSLSTLVRDSSNSSSRLSFTHSTSRQRRPGSDLHECSTNNPACTGCKHC